jgi:hypothetical protein
MKTHSFQRHLLTGLGFMALVAPAWSAQPGISAQLQPRRIALGESAQLAVTIQGSQSAEPNMPGVDGLEIEPVGQQSSMQIINGTASANVTYVYQVAAKRAGVFTVPAITATGAGSTQPIAFRVDNGTRGQTPRAPSQSRSQPPAPAGSREDAAVDAKGQSAFLRVALPKQELTVGELVPVQLKAYFRAGMAASLSGLPLLGSDAFSLGKIGEHPGQSQEMVDGQPFTVLTWDTTLSGVKAGEYPLNVDLPATIRVREKGRPGAHNPFKDFFGEDSPFGDSSFFDDFAGSVSEKEVTLHTDGAIVKVEAQPAKGRPADFSGAVGNFELTAEAPATTATVGEPFTLKIKVSGQGNFDRVNLSGLARTADWKTYRPSAKFAATDGTGLSGEKTFEQVVTPTRAGAQQIPSLSFSYFDPSDGHYVTRRTQPISLQIAAAAPASASTSAASTAAGGPAQVANAAPPAPRVNQSPIASLHPLVLRPWFIAANAAILLALALGALLRRLASRRSRDPESLAREAAESSIRASVASMENAEKKGDGPGFFLAARRALQGLLAQRWRIAPNEVTGPVIMQRLNGDGEILRTLFRAADEASYSKRGFTSAELRQWRDTFTKQLHRIKNL